MHRLPAVWIVAWAENNYQAAMDGDAASLNGLLAVVDRAMRRAYHVDPLLYAEMFELRTKLEQDASRADADVDLSRARRHARGRIRTRA